jgi:hypothetical protein
VATGLLQHLGGVELVCSGDEPRQLGRLLADPLAALPRRRVLHGLARSAGLVAVRASHEHDGLRNLRRDRDRDREQGRRGRGRLWQWQWHWQWQDELVDHRSRRQRRHLLVATANALPLAALPLGLGGAVDRGEEGRVVAGREAEEVVERGVGGVQRVVHEAEQRVGDLGVKVVMEEAHVRGGDAVSEQRGGCRVEAERHGRRGRGRGGCFALAACPLACVCVSLRESMARNEAQPPCQGKTGSQGEEEEEEREDWRRRRAGVEWSGVLAPWR